MSSREWLGLGLLLLVYAAVSVVLDRQRRKHQEAELRQFAEDESLDENAVDKIRSARKATRSKAKAAVRVGIVWVNVPLLPILVGPLAFAQYVLGTKSILVGAMCFLGGFVAAWAWWSINISLWRRWAARRGIDAHELQWQAQDAQLIWPAGHFFERTELDNILNRMR